jgi:hypothetical protein
MLVSTIVLKPGGSIRDPVSPGLELGRVEEKIKKEKTRSDPARPDQKPGCNPLIFFY